MEGRRKSSGVNLVELGLLHRVDQALQATVDDRLGKTMPLQAIDNPRWIWFYQQKRNRVLIILLPSILSYLFGTLHPTGPIRYLVTHSPRLMWLDTIIPGDLVVMLGSVFFGLILFALYELLSSAPKLRSL
jgi:hypothetical protein